MFWIHQHECHAILQSRFERTDFFRAGEVLYR
jgi:hypothetical protein